MALAEADVRTAGEGDQHRHDKGKTTNAKADRRSDGQLFVKRGGHFLFGQLLAGLDAALGSDGLSLGDCLIPGILPVKRDHRCLAFLADIGTQRGGDADVRIAVDGDIL